MQAQSSNAGTLTVAKSLWKNEGPMAFYKGTLAPMSGIGISSSIQFGANEAMKKFVVTFNRETKPEMNPYHLTYPQLVLSGSVAGVLNAIVACPVEMVRIAM